MEHTPISRRETAPPTSNPHGTSLEDEEHIEPTEGLRRDSKLQILNEMYQKIKNGELGIALQESLGLFEGYLVNLNQSYKTNNSPSNKAQGQQPSTAGPSTKNSVASPKPISNKDSEFKGELKHLRRHFRKLDFFISDLKNAWDLHSQIPTERIGVFIDVVKEDKLKTWIEDLESTRLLILESVSGNLRITPMLLLMITISVLQDKTPDKLENIDNGVMTLLFCCGAYDQTNVICLLYESLIAQLLRTSYGFNTEHMRQENFKKAFEGDVDHLGSLFSELLSQLPEKTLVLCMIEGIDYYEGKNDDAILRCVHHLTDISQSLVNMKAKFKVVVTSKPGTQTVKRLTESGGLYEHDTISTER